MLTFPEHLEQPFLQLAQQEHKPVSQLIEQALSEFLEDWQDARLAEQAIERLERGESELFSLDDAERMLNEMDNQN